MNNNSGSSSINNINNNNNSSLGSGSFGIIKKAKNFKYVRHINNTLSNHESIFKIFKNSNKNLEKEYINYNKLNLKNIDPSQEYFIGISYKYEILENKKKK